MAVMRTLCHANGTLAYCDTGNIHWKQSISDIVNRRRLQLVIQD